MIPLFLAIGLLVLKRFVRSNFLVGGYFIAVAAVFYIVILSARISMGALRHNGWVFAAPSSNNPWYHFYSLYGESTHCNTLGVALLIHYRSLRGQLDCLW